MRIAVFLGMAIMGGLLIWLYRKAQEEKKDIIRAVVNLASRIEKLEYETYGPIHHRNFTSNAIDKELSEFVHNLSEEIKSALTKEPDETEDTKQEHVKMASSRKAN